MQTAYAIGLQMHRNANIGETSQAIVEALIEEAGFTGVKLTIDKDAEGKKLALEAFAGRFEPSDSEIPADIESHGANVGRLLLRIPAISDRDERMSLLSFVMPTISMAIHESLAYTSLLDYRDNLEQKVVRRTEELNTARDALEKSYGELREISESRERFFANINHELRTPLSLIRMVTETLPLREKAMSPRSLQDLQSVEGSVQRLLRMVDEMLVIAASRESKLVIHREKSDLAALLVKLVNSWMAAADNRGISLVNSGPAALTAYVDQAAVERIVMNLISNAMKFTPRGGSISVRLEVVGRDAHIEVTDTGPGFDREFLGRIFGRFEQGQAPPSGVARGSGIGLSLVKELTEAHGGRVVGENNRRGGALVRVVLPCESQTLDAAPTALSTRLLQPSDYGVDTIAERGRTVVEASHTPEATVLVAEDDFALRERLGDILSLDFRVILARDGIEAVELARRHLPDILVTDLGMPGMDGAELTERFRELPGNRLAPVIMLTAFGTIGDRLAGFEAGVIDYVTKPFSPLELIARIRSQLRTRALALRLAESERLTALSVMSAGLAHEIRNPANGVLNALEPLKMMLPPAFIGKDSPTGALLEVINVCSKQIADLSRELLGLRGSGVDIFAQEKFSTILARAMMLVSPALGEVQVLNETTHDPVLWCAPVLLTQALVNLIENGAQAAGKGGSVRIVTEQTGEALIVEVFDSGQGVPKALRSRIFEPFFTTKSTRGGSGLGLSLANEIAQRHKGALRLRDTPENTGAVFELELPLGAHGAEPRQTLS